MATTKFLHDLDLQGAKKLVEGRISCGAFGLVIGDLDL